MDDSERIFTIDDAASLVWSEFYKRTAEVIRLYGKVVVYYVKAQNTSGWRDLIGEDDRDWSPAEVLRRVGRHRASLDAVGADHHLYSLARKLIKWFEREPENLKDQLEFHELVTEFVELLPFVDLFPFDWDEKPEHRNWKMRQICGVFYSLVFDLDLPRSWFVYYARLFKEKSAETQPKRSTQPSLNEILNAEFQRNKNCLDSDSDEDELYVRYVLGKEPLESVLTSLKKKRENKEAKEQRQENQPQTSQGNIQSEPVHEPEGEVNVGPDQFELQSHDSSI